MRPTQQTRATAADTNKACIGPERMDQALRSCAPAMSDETMQSPEVRTRAPSRSSQPRPSEEEPRDRRSPSLCHRLRRPPSRQRRVRTRFAPLRRGQDMAVRSANKTCAVRIKIEREHDEDGPAQDQCQVQFAYLRLRYQMSPTVKPSGNGSSGSTT